MILYKVGESVSHDDVCRACEATTTPTFRDPSQGKQHHVNEMLHPNFRSWEKICRIRDDKPQNGLFAVRFARRAQIVVCSQTGIIE